MKANFKELVQSDTPVLVDFYAEWCGPCKMQAPILKDVAREVGDRQGLLKVDIVNKQTSREWRVFKMGFYLVLCNGEPANPYVGAFQLELLRQALHQLD